ncbi:MAG TPA: hypothetical protein VI981_02550 [Candidatus Paceibacterota bacterium]
MKTTAHLKALLTLVIPLIAVLVLAPIIYKNWIDNVFTASFIAIVVVGGSYSAATGLGKISN